MPRFLREVVPAVLLTAVVLALAAPPAAADEMDRIRAALEDPSPIRRYEAIEELARLATPEAVRELISLTGEEDNAWLAVRQLVNLRDRAVPYLLEALDDPDPMRLKYAIHALGELRRPEAVPKILTLLTNSDSGIRQNAVFALGYIKDPRAVEPLIERLRDPDNVVREYAAAALEFFGDKRAIPFLKEALRSEKGSVFNMATALYSLGDDDVIDLLIEKLREPDSTNRLYAVYALGKIQDVREVEPLIDCLVDDNVQWLAAKALINLGDLAVPALIRSLGRKERDVRLYATYALGEVGGQEAARLLAENLIDPDQLLREFTAEALVKLNDRTIVPRLHYFLEKGDFSIQSRVLKILGAIGDQTTPRRVYQLLDSPDAQVRGSAIFALGELGDETAAGKIGSLLGDSDPGVRRLAANALLKVGTGNVNELVEMLALSSGPTETGLIYILGKLKAREALKVIVTKLASPDPIVRRYATVALTEIGDPAVEENMVMMLSDTDPHVRMYATVGLMEFGGRLSIRLLLNALRDDETRWLAVRILDRIGPRGVDELIAALKDPRTQWYASETLVKLDGAVLPQLQESLKSDEEQIRNNIALILGEVRDRRAVAALLEAMQDESRLVSLAASSLITIGDPSAVEPLIQCLQHHNEQVRLYAAYALGHFNDTRAINPLIRLIEDRDPGIRGVAAYSLGLLKSKRATIPLIEALDDFDENVRISIIYALSKISDERSIPFIRERIRNDLSLRVRTAAQEALETILYRTRS